jgi:hypothetical protein
MAIQETPADRVTVEQRARGRVFLQPGRTGNTGGPEKARPERLPEVDDLKSRVEGGERLTVKRNRAHYGPPRRADLMARNAR